MQCLSLQMLKIVYRLKKDRHTLSQTFCKFINPSMFILQDIIGHSEKERKLQYKIFRRQKQNFRSSFQRVLLKGYSQMQSGDVFCKKGVLKNFAKFTGKHQVPEFFFNKVAGLSLKVYSKETLTQIFSCEFCEIFGTPILQNFSGWLLLQRVLQKRLFSRFHKNPWKAFGLVNILSKPLD